MSLGSRRWTAFGLLSVAFFAISLDFSLLCIALPAMESSLAMSAATAQWVISAYSMTVAGFLLVSARLGEIVGRRRLFMAGISLLAIASLLAGFANDPTTLIILRAFQGLGVALCNPAGLALATELFPHGAERHRAVGLWVIVGGSAGIALGMVVGGILVNELTWRSVLWINVPICIVLLALVPFFVPRDAPAAERPKLGAPGALLLAAALLVLVWTLARIPYDGGSGVTIARAIGTIVLFVLFVAFERRTLAPLIPSRIFAYDDFRGGWLLAVVQGAAYAGLALYASIYWQQVVHLSPLLTGLAFLPSALLMTVIVGPIVAPLVHRYSARAVSTVASVVMIVGMAIALYVTTLAPAWWLMLVVLLVACIGCFATFEIAMISALAHVDEADEDLASGVISTNNQIGLGLGVTVAAVLATGHEPATGTHLAFWSPMGFAVLTLLVSAIAIAGRRARTAPHRMVRVGKSMLLHRHRTSN